MNTDKYLQTLDDNLWPVITKIFPNSDYIFQDDNATCHKSYRRGGTERAGERGWEWGEGGGRGEKGVGEGRKGEGERRKGEGEGRQGREKGEKEGRRREKGGGERGREKGEKGEGEGRKGSPYSPHALSYRERKCCSLFKLAITIS